MIVKFDREANRNGAEPVRYLNGWPVEKRVDDVESDHAGANHGAGCDCAPQHISAGKFPDCEQTGNDCDDYARAGRPERNAGYHARIEKSAPGSAMVRVR